MTRRQLSPQSPRIPQPSRKGSLFRRRRPKSLWWKLALLSVIIALIVLGFNWLWSAYNSLGTPLAGGITTVFNRSSEAFTRTAPGLTKQEVELHQKGDARFEAVFGAAQIPVSGLDAWLGKNPAKNHPGLGPLFNGSSCASCHIGDGRSKPQLGGALVLVSLPTGIMAPSAAPNGPPPLTVNPKLGTIPVPGIGTQIRVQAIPGQLPDAAIEVRWQERLGQYGDGTPYSLIQPQVQLKATNPAKPIPPETLTSLRIAPPVFGLGLIEAVPEASIVALADPSDSNRDGISGKPNRVWDPQLQKTTLGRFGHKANTPTLFVQSASDYVNQMGVTNPLFPDEKGNTEVDQKTLEESTFYTQTLGVPARDKFNNGNVRRGEKLFSQANCAACHISTLKTGPAKIAALANQTIHPYSDLLVHDMGDGLADRRPDFEADGQEWRTTPLWGLGLTQTVLPQAGYLHDGRARTIEEAILWHGGEAEAAKQAFAKMNKDDRQTLLAFLKSL
jgi:CxxC motif-containing protein (DUF1111 family)